MESYQLHHKLQDPKKIFSYIQSGDMNPILSLCLTLLLVCGDIELNPGPAPSVYHCGFCELPVDRSEVAVACDECSIWYHKSCLEMSTSKFQYLNCSHVSWICMKCSTMNTETHLFKSFEIILENSFTPLDDNVLSNTLSTQLTPYSAHPMSAAPSSHIEIARHMPLLIAHHDMAQNPTYLLNQIGDRW